MSSLFNIIPELLEAYETAAANYDSEEILAEMAQRINAYEMALEEKADNYAALIAMIDGDNATIDKEIERLKRLKAVRTSLKERLKSGLCHTMKLLDRPKIKTALHSFTISKNPPSVNIIDERKIPAQFFTQPAPVVSKTEIMSALKRGEKVPGAALTQGESLRIR